MSQERDFAELPPAKKQKLENDVNTLINEIKETDIDFTEDKTETEDKKFIINDEKYNNFVSPEELERLREFKVLDEVKSNDEESNDDDSCSSDGKSEGLPEDEIEKMLEEDLPEGFKGVPKPKEKPYITRQKIVLEEKGVNHFEVLPLDWIMVRHFSGMPVYMHRATRVCTFSKPYFLGKGNTRRHDIPISAIPCLAYRRALQEEEKQKIIDDKIEEQIRNGTWTNAAKTHQHQPGKENQLTNTNTTDNSAISDQTQESTSILEKSCPFKRPVAVIRTEDNSVVASTEESGRITSEYIENPRCPFNTAEPRVEGTEENSTVPSSDQAMESTSDNLEIPRCPFKPVEVAEASEKTDPAGSETSEKTATVASEASEKMDPVASEASEKTNRAADEAIEKTDSAASEASEKSDLTASDASEITDLAGCEASEKTDPAAFEASEKTNPAVSEDSEKTDLTGGGASEKTDPASEEIPLNRQPVVLPGGLVMLPPRVESVNTSWKTQHLTPEDINDYCKKLFKFKTVNIMHFKRWADRRKYTKARKTLQYPTLPEGTKLITIPAQPSAGQENGGKANKRDWVMNMNGRSYLSVFHEYVHQALQKQPVYEFKQLENASSPYQATVYIGGMQYGVGHGSSKRQAKSAAARASIHILIPEMKDELDAHAHRAPQPQPQPHQHPHPHPQPPARPAEPDFTFFDYVGIEDPRITEFCAATCEPSPHAILRTCLLRNFGAGDRHIHTEMKKLEYQKIELTMKVGKHSATVVCKNKKTAKQRASQAILQALHPHVRSWGSLLRLYGSRSVKSCKERKVEEQQITLLQDQARRHEPNHAVLAKLRHEMHKLRARDAAVVPIGTLLLPRHHLPTHTASNLNNVDL